LSRPPSRDWAEPWAGGERSPRTLARCFYPGGLESACLGKYPIMGLPGGRTGWSMGVRRRTGQHLFFVLSRAGGEYYPWTRRFGRSGNRQREREPFEMGLCPGRLRLTSNLGCRQGIRHAFCLRSEHRMSLPCSEPPPHPDARPNPGLRARCGAGSHVLAQWGIFAVVMGRAPRMRRFTALRLSAPPPILFHELRCPRIFFSFFFSRVDGELVTAMAGTTSRQGSFNPLYRSPAGLLRGPPLAPASQCAACILFV